MSDAWNSAYSGGAHDLTVHGPNGFLRTFRSPGSTVGPEVTARHNDGSGNLDLTLTNPGDTEVRLTLSNADAYGERSSRSRSGPARRCRAPWT